MRKLQAKLGLGLVTVGVLVGVGAVAMANEGASKVEESLSGYQEVPALSTTGIGEFNATIRPARQEIKYKLTFSALETDATQAHIHFENATNNGAIVVFLCSNLGNGPAGTQACPAAGGTIEGTITPVDVGAGAAAQGIGAGEFDELVRAMRAGATYVNVHSVGHPGGEIRAQVD